jgi:hypothetical protein
LAPCKGSPGTLGEPLSFLQGVFTMSLKDQITEDMKTAMRAKDSERLGTIRLLQAAIKQKKWTSASCWTTRPSSPSSTS